MKNGKDEHYILSVRLEAEEGNDNSPSNHTTEWLSSKKKENQKERQKSVRSDLMNLLMLYWKNNKSPGSPCLNSSSLRQFILKTWQLVVTQDTTSVAWADKMRVLSAFKLFATLLRLSANVISLLRRILLKVRAISAKIITRNLLTAH